MRTLKGMSVPRTYPVDFKVALTGNDGPKGPVKQEIPNAKAWKALFGVAPMPRFDPRYETLVVIALGLRRTGGFKVEVTGVTRQVGGVVGLLDTVRWREVKPAGGAIEILTHPFCVFVCAIANSHPVFVP